MDFVIEMLKFDLTSKPDGLSGFLHTKVRMYVEFLPDMDNVPLNMCLNRENLGENCVSERNIEAVQQALQGLGISLE